MRKKAIIIPILMLLVLFHTRTTLAEIEHLNWINPAYNGYDPYYDRAVIAYKEGTQWNISLSVKNDYRGMPPPGIPEAINVTGIKVYFDWGRWYNVTFSPPIRMEIDEVKVFNIYNATPTIIEAPEAWVHECWVYVEYIPESGGEVRIDWNWHETNFAVMSENHLLSLMIYNKMYMIMSVTPPLWYVINVTEARVLMVQSAIKFTEGMNYYEVGIFSTARSTLESASLLLDEALNAWNTKGTALDDAITDHEGAQANYYNALADSSRKGADAALMNSFGWLLFGLGWTFIGIGLVIHGLKKPKTGKS